MNKLSRGTCRFVFKVRFKDQESLDVYKRTWRESSQIIHDESAGAQGTRLHEVFGEPFTVLAIAEWRSKEDRDRAMAALQLEYDENHPVFSSGGGKFIPIAHAIEIDEVWPMRTGR